MKTNYKKILAVVLAVLMLVPAVTMAVPEAEAATVEETPQFIEGEVIYEPTLTGSGNGVPEGWLAVPETQVPWKANNASGGWKNYNATSTTNGEINPEAMQFTEEGLSISLGAEDFGIVFPALTDSTGNAVENYMYTMKVSVTKKKGGSFGPITDVQGGVDYKGGTHFMVYDKGNSNDSHRTYSFANNGRRNDNKVSRTSDDAIAYPADGKMTITVYRCEGVNYYYINDTYLLSQTGMDCYGGATLNGIGIAFCFVEELVIHEIEVKKVIQKGITNMMTLPGATIRYCDTDGSIDGEKSQGLRFAASVDTTSDLYQYLGEKNATFGMLILPSDLVPVSGILTKDTPMVLDTQATKVTMSEDGKSLEFIVALMGIPEHQQDASFTARAYVKWQEGDDWEYTYSIDTITRSYSRVANLFYEEIEEQMIAKMPNDVITAKEKAEEIRARLDDIFQRCSNYEGANAKQLTFALFSDFHYMDGTYMSTIADMQAILERANNANASFIIHAGDFCNDYSGSPELFKTYLKNSYNLPALGIYGNHELESIGNSMKVVTPLLNNDIANKNVVWGTPDGEIGDGSIAYYYYEVNGFRMVCLDTNYSYNETIGKWEHNATATSSPAATNKYWHSLGPVQLKWLEDTLMDAAEKDIPCIVFSHANLSGVLPYNPSPDYKTVQEIFAAANDKEPGTVLMAINGHIHTNHINVVDNVLYLDVNTVRNGVWQEEKQDIYTDETFKYIKYDDDGNPVGEATDRSLDELYYGKNTWFFKDPLSAIVHISSSGRIVIEGSETEWISDVIPNTGFGDGMEPKISSGVYSIPLY